MTEHGATRHVGRSMPRREDRRLWRSMPAAASAVIAIPGQLCFNTEEGREPRSATEEQWMRFAQGILRPANGWTARDARSLTPWPSVALARPPC
jgi:hypothetical protein